MKPEKMGIDMTDEHVLRPEEAVTLVYFGYLNKGRGLEYAIQALKLLPERFRLLLIGGGDLEAELRSLTRDTGLEERVEFTGWVEPDEGRRYLRQGHIGLNLLDCRSVSYYYSLANKTFDYLQAGIPAIHMDFPEYRLLSDQFKCFILIEELDAQLIAQALMDIAAHPEHYSFLTESSNQAASALCWENELPLLIRFFENILT